MVNDYHSASLRRGDQAIIHLRLLIDAAGLPTACSVQSTVGHGSFAEISCNHIIERARFEAALTVGLTAVRHSVQVPSFSHLRDLMRPRGVGWGVLAANVLAQALLPWGFLPRSTLATL